jgi:hypothetical protein
MWTTKKLFVSVIIFLFSVGAWAAWQDRTQLLTNPAGSDEVLVNDVSDTTDDDDGTVKRTTLTNLMKILGTLISDSGAFRVSETTEDAAWSFQIYDNDDATWRDCLTFTNGDTPRVTVGTGCGFDGIDTVNVSAISKLQVNSSALVNDSAGNGDTSEVYSADKVYDQLALKQDKAGAPWSYSDSITDPVDADDMVTVAYMPKAVTVTNVYCNAQGGGDIDFTLQYCDADGSTNCTTVTTAINCDGGQDADDGTIDNPTVAAGKTLKILFGAPTGTVDALAWTVLGTQTW